MNKTTTPAFKVTMPDGKPGPVRRMDCRICMAKCFERARCAEGHRRSRAFRFQLAHGHRTGCFIAAILAGLLLGLGPGRLLQIFGRTLVRLRFAIVAMTCMLGWLCYALLRHGRRFSLAFTRTGWFFPFFGTFIGWLE